jgi:hypothetical protein
MSQAATPPQESAPNKKRTGTWLVLVVVAVVLIVVIVQAVRGGNSSSAASTSGDDAGSSTEPAGLNEPVRDGRFEFTVTGVDCSRTTLGTVRAEGVFCLVSVRVQNISDQPQTLDATSQRAYDAQQNEYTAHPQATLAESPALFAQLDTGAEVDGRLVFDVPAGTRLTQIELHDSAFSGGATVGLG